MSHAGYRGEEYPRSLVLDGRVVDITSIDSQWIEQDADQKKRSRCFRVKGNDGHRYLLCCDDMTGDWYLE